MSSKIFKYLPSSKIPNIFNKKNSLIELKVTKNFDDVDSIGYAYVKNFFEYKNGDIFYTYLAEEYEPLLFSYNNFTLPELDDYKKNRVTNERIKIVDNNVKIDDYVLVPVSKGYRYNVISSLFFDYYNIMNELPSNTELCVIQIVGPWEIHNKELWLDFEFENIMINNRCKVKTIFLLVDYGEDVSYNKVHAKIKSNEYIIVNTNDIDKMKEIDDFIKNINNFFIFDYKINTINTCQYEVATLPLYLFITNIILKSMKKGGNLFLELHQMYIMKPFLQYLYYLSTLFGMLKVLMKIINIGKYAIYKFENYQYIDTILDKIITKYLKMDIYLGQNTIIETDLTYCESLDKKKRKPHINFVIKSIIKKHINDDFMNFIISTYDYKNQQIKKQLDKISYMKEQGDNLDVGIILANNISKSIEFCNKHNIEVNDIYDKFTTIKYDDVVKTYFPQKPGVNLKYIKLSTDSVYSITRPSVAKYICKLIKEKFKDVTVMIDGNANVGTTTIAFSEYFKYVYSIEYDKITFDKLNNNIKVYGLKNVETFLDDTILFMNDAHKLRNIKFNINNYCLCLDPPWTGVFYKTEKELDLYLSDINILDFIKKIDIKYVAIKVPFNFNFKLLYKYFYNVTIHRLAGIFLVLIIK